MDDVAEYADKVMVFSKGELVMYDTPQVVFADYKFLESMGLSVPQGKKVLELLKERGVDIDTSPYTTDGAILFFHKRGFAFFVFRFSAEYHRNSRAA